MADRRLVKSVATPAARIATDSPSYSQLEQKVALLELSVSALLHDNRRLRRLARNRMATIKRLRR